MLFLSRRSSSACSATTSFSVLASRRRSVTSLLVAARAVSPASRRLPARYNNALGLIALCAAFVFTIVFFAFNHSAIISGLDLKSRYFYAVLGAIVVALTCIYAVLFAKRYAAEE